MLLPWTTQRTTLHALYKMCYNMVHPCRPRYIGFNTRKTSTCLTGLVLNGVRTQTQRIACHTEPTSNNGPVPHAGVVDDLHVTNNGRARRNESGGHGEATVLVQIHHRSVPQV